MATTVLDSLNVVLIPRSGRVGRLSGLPLTDATILTGKESLSQANINHVQTEIRFFVGILLTTGIAIDPINMYFNLEDEHI
jgi:hypothetical protein